MTRLHALVLIGACLAVPVLGQEPAAVPASITEATFPVAAEDMMRDVQFLASDDLRGREAGTSDAERAANWIAQRFRELGLEPAGDDEGYVQAFTCRRISKKDDVVQIGFAPGRNVLGWLPGSDPELRDQHFIVGAHFDHLGRAPDGRIFNGADDNASGVAGLLAIARALSSSETRPRHTVLFAAFDAEEKGLQGSRHYVAHPVRPLEDVVVMFNLDMIGRPRFLDQKSLRWLKPLAGVRNGPGVGIVGGDRNPKLLTTAKAVCKADDLPAYAPGDFGSLKERIQSMVAGRADHAPFADKGIPHLFFSTSEHDDYHQPTDTADKVDGPTLRRVTAAVWRTLLATDARDDRPPHTSPSPGTPR